MEFSRRHVLSLVIAVIAVFCIIIIIFQYVSPEKPETTMSCGVHIPAEEGPLYLVCVGSGTVKSVDAYGQQRLIGMQEEYGYASFGGGQDENSGSSYTIVHMPDDAVSWVSITNGRSIINSRSIHSCFCEDCAEKISDILPLFQRHTYVLYDAVAEEYHSIAIGTEQIGDYIIEVTKEDNGYHLVVTTLA